MKSTKTHAETLSSFREDKIVELSSYEERRQHPRYPVKLPLDLWQTPDLVLGGVVTNMSEVGLGFNSLWTRCHGFAFSQKAKIE
jgi:hypothetical protein